MTPQACIAMLANLTIDEAVNICGTEGTLTKEQLIKIIKKLNIYDGGFRTYRVKENLPYLCILYVQFPTYDHLSVYYNGKIYDPEFGIIDEYISYGNIVAYMPIKNNELLNYIEISVPLELQNLLENNEEAYRNFNELPASKRIEYVRSINMRNDSKEERVRYIFNLLLNNKGKTRMPSYQYIHVILKNIKQSEILRNMLLMN